MIGSWVGKVAKKGQVALKARRNVKEVDKKGDIVISRKGHKQKELINEGQIFVNTM